MQMLAMTVGEINYTDLADSIIDVFAERGIAAEVAAFIIVGIFIIVMPITVMNWFLAVAVNDVPTLIEENGRITLCSLVNRISQQSS